MQFVIPLQKPKKYVVKMTFTEPRKLQAEQNNFTLTGWSNKKKYTTTIKENNSKINLILHTFEISFNI